MYQAICYSFTAIKVESTKIDLAVNERKTKYMLSTSKDVWPTDPHITADNYNFDIVKEFILAPFLPPKMSVWRSDAGSLLPANATIAQ